MLKTYYTSGGRKVVPIAFDSGLYSCNDGKGKRLLLKPDQLFETNPRKKVKLEKPMGLSIDYELNDKIHGKECLISKADSKTAVYVLPTNEELMIARSAMSFVK